VIVLDTHVWVWWTSRPEKLSARVRHAIDGEAILGVSVVSCWEVATLVRRGRLGLDRDVLVWVKQALALPRIELLPLTPDVAVAAGSLSESFPGDPADRLVVASALAAKSMVATKDARIRASGAVRCVW
jgi:PIN domain nuclease of toxin-antitoxin system